MIVRSTWQWQINSHKKTGKIDEIGVEKSLLHPPKKLEDKELRPKAHVIKIVALVIGAYCGSGQLTS